MQRKPSGRKLLRSAALTLLALVSAAHAGDRTDIQRVAFSPHGTRALVVTGGVQDGSGFSVAALTALDTGTGRTLLSARARSETRPVPAVVDALLVQERSRLAPQGLTPERTARPVYARSFPVLAPVWTEGVRALPSACASPEMLPGDERPAGFTLTVNGQTVHADRVLPPERSCAARYALDRVYVQGNRAVFILRAYTPGFEGPNAEPVVVAATLR